MFHMHMLRLSNLSYAIGLFLFDVSEELMLNTSYTCGRRAVPSKKMLFGSIFAALID